ncbi:MAG: FkbM family methyltransferase [Pseudobacter sp.]|uniref:FkbM family methyltransferase n=1 Tax=Pseudobacter sp. TaxID=2045420 RepID=UPI003F7D96B7
MSILSTIRFITNHPINKDNKVGSIFRFLKWQINTRLNQYPIIYSFTDKSKLIVKKGMAGATGNLYCGVHEFQDMFFLLHFLREDDLFADIGANIGSYTVLAAAHVGANSISFEPVPSTFAHLKNNIYINQLDKKVRALNIALGSQKGSIAFTSSYDTVNHVATASEKDTISVPVEILDEVLQGEIPALIKIDVEGFETEVINGAQHILANEKLKAIVIELNGSGSRYGYSEEKIHERLLNLGFVPYQYDPFRRVLNDVSHNGPEENNTIYVRDRNYVEQRLKSADKVNILGKAI